MVVIPIMVLFNEDWSYLKTSNHFKCHLFPSICTGSKIKFRVGHHNSGRLMITEINKAVVG